MFELAASPSVMNPTVTRPCASPPVDGFGGLDSRTGLQINDSTGCYQSAPS